ncbi:hypothetical protein C8F04DRAFT_1266869 [Mycena alexandri]|uniref:Ribonuclease H1 N-terminal domain-containing protein n=1 Tax=Mycena alexandri TaxID=1745969 RepID=A0AAD6SIQ6_9AGAR|nr:hypothetical protein C8F04DRAFT_1266869 [Mycena alexandri]
MLNLVPPSLPSFTSSPPPYDDDDNELHRLLANSAYDSSSDASLGRIVSPVTPRRTRIVSPVTPTPARTVSSPAPAISIVTLPSTDTRPPQLAVLLLLDAAARTQGVSGGSPRRLEPKKKSSKKRGGYAVFFGRQIGAFPLWDDVQPLVIGVRCSLFQGYPTLAQAQAAFDYAAHRAWCHSKSPHPSLDSPSPLHPDNTNSDGRWYVVYSGVTPGVYSSYLECALNTLGLSGAVHDSFGEKSLAVAAFEDARAWTAASGDPFIHLTLTMSRLREQTISEAYLKYCSQSASCDTACHVCGANPELKYTYTPPLASHVA